MFDNLFARHRSFMRFDDGTSDAREPHQPETDERDQCMKLDANGAETSAVCDSTVESFDRKKA